MKSKRPSQTLPAWLKSNLGPRCLAPLTGTDDKALAAAVEIIELYAYHTQPEVLYAFAHVVECMQDSTRYLAYHAIAHILDWDDRRRVWNESGLAPISNPGVCKFEPQDNLANPAPVD